MTCDADGNPRIRPGAEGPAGYSSRSGWSGNSTSWKPKAPRPTPSAFILAAVLIAPVMKSLGVDLMAGHLFLLYFAVMSALTPPVAVAAYAASAIADAPPLNIAGMAVRIAIGAFLVPFTFIYDPALLLEGAWYESVVAFVLVGTGLMIFVVGQEGYFRVNLGMGTRLACFAGGLLLMFARPISEALLA